MEKIISDTQKEFVNDVALFQQNYGQKTSFEELNKKQLREQLWESLFNRLADDSQASLHYDCLSTLRILSRDKTNLGKMISKKWIEIILDTACLNSPDKCEANINSNTTIESAKLLCNLLFNCPKVQDIILETPCLSCLISRLKNCSVETSSETILFYVKIIFLITALKVPPRQMIKTELNGDIHLYKILESICSQYNDEVTPVKTQDATLVCEILKALFNLYINADDTEDGRAEKHKNLVSVLYKLLKLKCPVKEDDLQSNIANLLAVVPYESYTALIPPAPKRCTCVFQNRDMTAVSTLVNFLGRRLNCTEDLIGNLTPIVTSFIRLTKAEKHVRRYVRLQILPPLKDVMKRPEEGYSPRAKLCILLTTPLTELRDLVAEFLFILCKENVSRMVKYTGYGNAAGMFANKGLLGHVHKQNCSSESEDSDTEEYLQHREQINPVTGCFEHPKPNPLEGMTEEQKEYEALQLVGLMDKLTRGGVVQPCRIGEDGKPKPIEHVLQLQEELPQQQQLNRRNSDSD